MPIPVETAAGSKDQRQDVVGSGTPYASGTVRGTGEVAAEKDLAAPGRRRWLDAHSLASGEGFHRYLPWCRVVRPVTGALGRLVGVVAVALRIG